MAREGRIDCVQVNRVEKVKKIEKIPSSESGDL